MIDKRRKKVCFPEDPSDLAVCYPCIPILSELSLEDRNLRWFSAREYEEFKQRLTLISREVRTYGYGKLLDNVYGDSDKESSQMESLERWSRHSYSGRGAERHCNRKHGSQRKALQERCIRMVLQTQKEIQASDDDKIERIAKVSKNASKEARQFAVKMGLADAKAIVQPKNINMLRSRSRISRSILYRVSPQVGHMSRSPSS